MGFGDVKLAGLVGFLVGFPGWLLAVSGASLGGIAFVLVRRSAGRAPRDESVAFAPFLAAAAVAAATRPAAHGESMTQHRRGATGAVLAAFFLLAAARGGSEQIREMQFVNQPITDILLALAEVSATSIIPDDTVSGSASYLFSAMEFETALKVFLATYKLYYRHVDGVYYVSRISVAWNAQAGTISLDAEEVDIAALIRAASRAVGRTILFDPLPAQTLTVHATGTTVEKLLEIMLKRFPDYRVDVDKDYYYVRRVAVTPAGAASLGLGAARIDREGDRYSLQVEKGRFIEILESLFAKAGVEYSLMTRKEVVLEKLRFQDKSFEQILRLVLEQGNADYTVIGRVYYVFEIDQREVLKKLNTTTRIGLNYLSAKELANLMPPDLLAAPLYRIDATHNSVILSGSVEEIGPAQEFLRSIDRPVAGRSFRVYRLGYLSVAKLATLLPPDYRHIEPIVIPESNSFVALLSDEVRSGFESYLAQIDRPPASVMVKLRYLKAEELLKKLPPSVVKDDIVETADPTVIFVKGAAEKIAEFRRDLEIVDRPVPQIRYQFLVLQYHAGEALDWTTSFGATPSGPTSANSFIGALGNLMALNFDIVSTFGLQFAIQLNMQLNTNDVRIMADTALVGLSGQELEFRNTETFRYQEVEVDEEGNTRYTGVTREITSGLIFKVLGWVSGDDMITMNVRATISKRGSAASTTVGALPTTSENVVNTLARSRSGTPLVIGGLMRQDTDVRVSKVPLLGDLPVIGLLFQSRKESLENSELAVYIVPRVEYGDAAEDRRRPPARRAVPAVPGALRPWRRCRSPISSPCRRGRASTPSSTSRATPRSS